MARGGGSRPVKYRQIAADLRARIERGEWPVDAQMPTLPELGAHYRAAGGTIAKALDVLNDLGMAETVQGMGTFVRTPPPERSEYEELRKQVAELRQEVTELRERVGRIDARLATVAGKPRGGARDQATAAASSGKR